MKIYHWSKYPSPYANLTDDLDKKLREHTEERSKYILWKAMSRAAQEAQSWADRFAKCESPIEQLALYDMMCLEEDLGYSVEPQVDIEANGKTYRADFVVIGSSHEGDRKKVVVEADGHDFHEKTKEQAAKDKKRDRDLVQEGYIVLHFTGSEIYNKPGIVWNAVFGAIVGGGDGS